ncbi:beta-1,4-galactosyltransferase 2 [Latimeria chalumnae]|uniref:Beta-1,4-galactosyltransferase n=1 Tax=Latimeria chalumnae TaxID=7897 RepID=H3AH27_LATCH|nr:PREDICTED: beta-1,4-galactosyltransferase 2 [Latimeria chalumnae]|eukprot:XP_005999968.1 PREDICTED: beta-1,4-galactosyltransferase 2 [Latimeria chalumnae]
MQKMTRLMVGKTLERICKAVLLLCFVHFLIMMILYFDVYTQRLDLFSRFNARNYSRAHHGQYYNLSRPNATFPPFLGGGDRFLPSGRPEANQTATRAPLPPCPDVPSGLVGRLLIEFSSQMTLEKVQKENPDVKDGGKYLPPDCKAKQKVAIIIPFRHREHHLKYWLHYLHPILRRQKIEYRIYIINQYGEDTFNRAKLLNIGYKEASKDEDYNCFIFSDVDLVPMDDRNLYHCYDQPRHFAIAMDKFGFRLPYAGYFGGVSGLSKTQFLKINGFPNEYWGWGGEDDDIYNRITLNGMKISRPDIRIGRYRMVKHDRDKHNEPNPQRFTKIQNTKMTMRRDGINTLKYELVETVRHSLYTNVTVNIGRPPPRPMRG